MIFDIASRTSFHFATNSAFSLGDAPFFYKPRFNFVFFHNVTDRTISDVINNFQPYQLLRDSLHGPTGSPFRRCRTGNCTNPCFLHHPVTFRCRFFCSFLPRADSIPSVTKRWAIPAIVLWEAPYASFDTVIRPGTIFRLLIQL